MGEFTFPQPSITKNEGHEDHEGPFFLAASIESVTGDSPTNR